MPRNFPFLICTARSSLIVLFILSTSSFDLSLAEDETASANGKTKYDQYSSEIIEILDSTRKDSTIPIDDERVHQAVIRAILTGSGNATDIAVSTEAKNFSKDRLETILRQQSQENPAQARDLAIAAVKDALAAIDPFSRCEGIATQRQMAATETRRVEQRDDPKPARKVRNIGFGAMPDGDFTVVSFVVPDQPAARAGLKRGDIIRSVNGKPVNDRLKTLLAFGDVLSPGTIEVRRGTTELSLAISADEEPSTHVAVVNSTMVISIDRLNKLDILTLEKEMKKHEDSELYNKITSIVIDLRRNSGGNTEVFSEFAGFFLPSGTAIAGYYQNADSPISWRAVTLHQQTDTTTPLVILVNGATASAAEGIAGAMQDFGRALIVGERTIGKGTEQEEIVTQNPLCLIEHITKRYWWLPSGRSVQNIGLVPNIEFDDHPSPLSVGAMSNTLPSPDRIPSAFLRPTAFSPDRCRSPNLGEKNADEDPDLSRAIAIAACISTSQ